MGTVRTPALTSMSVGFGMAAVLLAGCSDGAPASEPTAVAPPAAGPTEELSDGDVEAAIREDGRHAVYLHGMDLEGRTLTVDVVQWLSGEAAARAYEEETGETGGPPNDHFILNTDPRIWTLDVSEAVSVMLVRLHQDADADADPGTWEELPDYVADQDPGDGRLSWSPFWATVENQVIVGLEEQYVP